MLPWDRGRKLYAKSSGNWPASIVSASGQNMHECCLWRTFTQESYRNSNLVAARSFCLYAVLFVLFIVLQNGSEVNKSAIREVLSTHKFLASSVTPTKDFKKLCVDIFKKYEDMVGLMIKCDPGFLKVRL